MDLGARSAVWSSEACTEWKKLLGEFDACNARTLDNFTPEDFERFVEDQRPKDVPTRRGSMTGSCPGLCSRGAREKATSRRTRSCGSSPPLGSSDIETDHSARWVSPLPADFRRLDKRAAVRACEARHRPRTRELPIRAEGSRRAHDWVGGWSRQGAFRGPRVPMPSLLTCRFTICGMKRDRGSSKAGCPSSRPRAPPACIKTTDRYSMSRGSAWRSRCEKHDDFRKSCIKVAQTSEDAEARGANESPEATAVDVAPGV